MIQSIFIWEEVKVVLSMPLSIQNQAYLIQWWLCKDGLFTIKPAYWIGRPRVFETQAWATIHSDEEWWKQLWKMEIPPS